LKDGRLWGRGTADDKGPLIAALYAVKLLKDNGLIKGYRVKLVSAAMRSGARVASSIISKSTMARSRLMASLRMPIIR
jgi:hypothetical protein